MGSKTLIGVPMTFWEGIGQHIRETMLEREGWMHNSPAPPFLVKAIPGVVHVQFGKRIGAPVGHIEVGLKDAEGWGPSVVIDTLTRGVTTTKMAREALEALAEEWPKFLNARKKRDDETIAARAAVSEGPQVGGVDLADAATRLMAMKNVTFEEAIKQLKSDLEKIMNGPNPELRFILGLAANNAGLIKQARDEMAAAKEGREDDEEGTRDGLTLGELEARYREYVGRQIKVTRDLAKMLARTCRCERCVAVVLSALEAPQEAASAPEETPGTPELPPGAVWASQVVKMLDHIRDTSMNYVDHRERVAAYRSKLEKLRSDGQKV